MKGNVLLSVRQGRHKIVYQGLLSYNNLTINNVSENRQMTNYGLQNCIAEEVSTILHRIKLCYHTGKLSIGNLYFAICQFMVIMSIQLKNTKYELEKNYAGV